ncbi:MAG: hypothetical protein RL701_3782 [Pseudomonadota bacterium]
MLRSPRRCGFAAHTREAAAHIGQCSQIALELPGIFITHADAWKVSICCEACIERR